MAGENEKDKDKDKDKDKNQTANDDKNNDKEVLPEWAKKMQEQLDSLTKAKPEDKGTQVIPQPDQIIITEQQKEQQTQQQTEQQTEAIVEKKSKSFLAWLLG